MLTFGSVDVEEIPSDANVKGSLNSSDQQLAGGSWIIGTCLDSTQAFRHPVTIHCRSEIVHT